MKLVFLAGLFASLGAHSLRAAPADLALVAAMKLPDAANYSWRTSMDDDARSYVIDGQTDRASDLSLVTMPMVAAGRHGGGELRPCFDGTLAVMANGDRREVDVQSNRRDRNQKRRHHQGRRARRRKEETRGEVTHKSYPPS